MTTPRTPVLVGYGQVNQHDEDPSVEPIDLMAAAARAAADPRVLQAVDSVRIVNILSWRYRDPGRLLAQQHPRRRRDHPLHRSGRQRAADTGQPGMPGHPVRTRGSRSHRGRRNLPHPNAIAQPRPQAGLDESRRVGAVRRGRQRESADGGPGGAPHQTGPGRVCLPTVRAGAADQGGGVAGHATAGASANCGHSSAMWHRPTRTPGAEQRCRPRRSGSRAKTTG